MKLSWKTVLIGIVTLAIIGASIAYYSITNKTNKESESLGWESSSWLYRKTIDIPNKGPMVINKTVSIILDTKSLISTNKLQPDCEDLRFLDNDGSITLPYQIEEGCNTTSTKIRVKIPSLPANGKTIYVLYGNPTALKSQEQL